jgi:hypothetical protein
MCTATKFKQYSTTWLADPPLLTVFIHVLILRVTEFDPVIKVFLKSITDTTEHADALSITFDRPEIPKNSLSAMLAGLMFILDNIDRNVPLLICTSSDFLASALVKERRKFEYDILDAKFRLITAVIAKLKEQVARVEFKRVTLNQAKPLIETQLQIVKIETEIDCMFELPGIPLAHRSQRQFTKIIRKREPKPMRRSTFVNLDQIRCSVEEVSDCMPTDETIWKSIQSGTLQRLTREFYWKCIHNTFRVGDFWLCPFAQNVRLARSPNTLEHIALEYNHPGQRLVWNLTVDNNFG